MYSEHHTDEYDIVSKVAYLIGVPVQYFENTELSLDVYDMLDKRSECRIIRNLCYIFTTIQKNYTYFRNSMANELKNLHTLDETKEAVTNLRNDGVDIIKANGTLDEYRPRIAQLITNHISDCKDVFPMWVPWDYIKKLFAFPSGTKRNVQENAYSAFMQNLDKYPFRMYLNWNFSGDDSGNILYNDEKFMVNLFRQNGEIFTAYDKVRGESATAKDNIFSFLDSSHNVVALVDCENSDPLKICAVFQSMDMETISKIKKIILYNDVNASSVWTMLRKYTKATVEHKMTERVLETKSVVDASLIVGCCTEHYMNHVDSFLLFSSDSDYWALINQLVTAKFLVMVEKDKTSYNVIDKMKQNDVPYCYIDEFCQAGDSYELRLNALTTECEDYIEKHFAPTGFNVNEMVAKAFDRTRVRMTPKEEKNYKESIIKKLHLDIGTDGEVRILIR